MQPSGTGTVVILVADDRFVDICIRRYHGKNILDSVIQVSRPPPPVLDQLRKEVPGLFGTEPSVEVQKAEPAADTAALNAVLKAISNLSVSQQDALR